MWQTNLRRLEFEWRRICQLNPATLAVKVAIKLLGLVIGLLLLPVTLLLHLAGYRHVNVFTDRIGHLAIEPDCLLKEQALGHIRKKKWIMLAPPGRVANEHLIAYWQPYFRIVRGKSACFLIANMSRWGLMRYNVGHYARILGTAQDSFRIYAEWSNRTPLLRLSPDDKVWAATMMQRIGIPSDAWFVCVHSREGGFSPIDEELHRHRNSHIANFLLAIEEIIRRGGWVIRIGDPTMEPLSPMHRVIDYAHHPIKSPRLDVILCASARFILGTTSGIALVGTIFGIPCAMTNLVPTADLWYGPQDISIPKRMWSDRESRYLSLAEAMENPTGSYRYAQQYIEAGLRPIENSPEDLRDLVVEMFNHLNGSFAVTEGDATMTREFRRRITKLSPAYFSQATIGIQFLRKYSSFGKAIPLQAPPA